MMDHITTQNWFLEVANSRDIQNAFLVISYDQGFGDNDLFRTFASALAYFDTLPGGELWFFTLDSEGRRSFCLLLHSPAPRTSLTIYAVDYLDACRYINGSPWPKSYTRVLLARSPSTRDLLAHRLFYARGRSTHLAYRLPRMVESLLGDDAYAVLFAVHGEHYTRFGGSLRRYMMHRRLPINVLCLTVLHFEGKGLSSNLYWRV